MPVYNAKSIPAEVHSSTKGSGNRGQIPIPKIENKLRGDK